MARRDELFLGNHDVSRFVSQADAGGWADSEDSACLTGSVPTNGDIYDRLRLGWTFLMTQPGLPSFITVMNSAFQAIGTHPIERRCGGIPRALMGPTPT